VIEINRTGSDDPLRFRVIVREGATESRHEVTLSRADCNRLTAGRHTPNSASLGRFVTFSIASPRRRFSRLSTWG
jgi:hypothetical protein